MASEGKKPGEGSGTPKAAPPPAPRYPRLNHIEITNYKALDHLVLDIPAPRMPADPDIFVVGSKNGVGKTSLLECCVMAQLNFHDRDLLRRFFHYIRDSRKEILPLFWNPHAPFAIKATHKRYQTANLQWADEIFTTALPRITPYSLGTPDTNSIFRFTNQFFGYSPDILLHNNVLFFHSYRKISEGPTNSQEILTTQRSNGVSAVKHKAVHLLLASAGVIDFDADNGAEQHLELLNELLTTFAGGRIDKKLHRVGKDHHDIRIVTPRGATFSFDGLSSGQKEIITTLFLIWNETLSRPTMVLLDEPELHLNAEWQREFLRHLHRLAPNNQYILTTHSEDVFASVSEERRVLLDSSGD